MKTTLEDVFDVGKAYYCRWSFSAGWYVNHITSKGPEYFICDVVASSVEDFGTKAHFFPDEPMSKGTIIVEVSLPFNKEAYPELFL